MKRNRKAKILATLGPSSSDKKISVDLINSIYEKALFDPLYLETYIDESLSSFFLHLLIATVSACGLPLNPV